MHHTTQKELAAYPIAFAILTYLYYTFAGIIGIALERDAKALLAFLIAGITIYFLRKTVFKFI